MDSSLKKVMSMIFLGNIDIPFIPRITLINRFRYNLTIENKFIRDIDQGRLSDDEIKTHIHDPITVEQENNLDPSLTTVMTISALAAAAYLGKLNAVKTLIRLGASPDAADNNGITPLMLACGQGFPEVVNELLTATKNIDQQDSEGNSALMWAIADPTALYFKLLEIHGDILLSINKNDGIKLFEQASLLYASIIQKLLNAGADINQKNNAEKTPLIIACLSHNVPIAKALIHAGAHINEQSAHGSTALIYAIRSKALEKTESEKQLIKILIDAGADTNLQDKNGTTALIEAAMFGDLETVHLLLNVGADPNKQNIRGDTALVYAACNREKPDIEQLLIDHGADVHIKNNAGKTALDQARKEQKSFYHKNTIAKINILEKAETVAHKK